jgi:hypothetical protein
VCARAPRRMAAARGYWALAAVEQGENTTGATPVRAWKHLYGSIAYSDSTQPFRHAPRPFLVDRTVYTQLQR